MTDPLILLTTDFSAESARAYDPAVDLAAKLGGRILLVHVAELTTIVPHGAPLAPAQIPPDASELIEAAETAIASEAKKLGSKVPVESHVEAAADVAEGVTSVARDRGAAYIAVSTHGRTGLRRLVLGSVTEAIVRHAHVPVICFPAH